MGSASPRDKKAKPRRPTAPHTGVTVSLQSFDLILRRRVWLSAVKWQISVVDVCLG